MAIYRCLLIDSHGQTHNDAGIVTQSLAEANDFVHAAGELLAGWGYELWEDEKLIISTAPNGHRLPPRRHRTRAPNPWMPATVEPLSAIDIN